MEKRVLIFELLRMLVLWLIMYATLIMGAYILESTPPGPALQLGCLALVGILVTIAAVLFCKARKWRLFHAIPALITLGFACLYAYSELEVAGSDMWRVAHWRLSLFEHSVSNAFGCDPHLPDPAKYRISDPIPQEPPNLGATRSLVYLPPSDYVDGPYYQRYLREEDLEEVGWQPTATWTDDPRIILVYTPTPILWRRWFRVVPDAWMAFHGDGTVKRYQSADELRDALTVDAKRRAELGLPEIPYEVFEK